MNEGLIGRIGKGGGYYDGYGGSSRDYAIDIPCQCVTCGANKAGFCSMPSAIRIGPGGMCKTKFELTKGPKRPIDGD